MSRKTLKPRDAGCRRGDPGVVPTAGATPTDLRSPDARDAARGAPAVIPATSTASTDRRSRDSRHTARVVVVNKPLLARPFHRSAQVPQAHGLTQLSQPRPARAAGAQVGA